MFKRSIFALLPVVLLAFGASPAMAEADKPWWHLISEARPAVLEPGEEGTLLAHALNLGDAPTSGEITVAVTLPAGVSIVEEEVEGEFKPKIALGGFGRDSKGRPGGNRSYCNVVAKTVTCTVPPQEAAFPPVLPYENVSLAVWVKAGAETKEPQETRTEVSGGGAAPVAVTRTVPVASAPPAFGVEHFEVVPEADDGSVDAQAGSHPFALTTSLSLNQTANPKAPPALPRTVRFQLPPGIVGNAQAVPQCSEVDFRAITEFANHCPPDTAVGAGYINVEEYREGENTWTVPIFNLVPAPGEPARFGFTVALTPVTIDTGVRTGSDYGVTATVNNISEAINFLSEVVSLWGVPDDPAHDESRGYACLAGGEANDLHESTEQCHPPSTQTARVPFLTNPTSCATGFTAGVEGESWPLRANPQVEPPSSAKSVTLAPGSQNTYSLKDAFGNPLGIGGCNALAFSPFIEVAPDVQSASTSTGLKVDVKVPQEVNENGSGLASSSVKDITVALPEGVQVNPSGGNGLEACSDSQVGFEAGRGENGFEELNPVTEPGSRTPLFSPTVPEPLEPGVNLGAEGFCPNASKIGTVEIHSPLIKHPLDGSVYLASQNANPFGSLIAPYIVAEDPESGVLVKLPGEVHLTPSGQLVSTFKNNPQLPFEDASLHFFGGERAPLATPARCGTYTTQASFVPWSAEAWDEAQQTKDASSSFQITSGPNGSPCPGATLPFNPSLTGGTTSVQAGAFSPLSTTIDRQDGNQDMSSVQLHFPLGLSGLLSSVKLCGEAEANAGSCGPESLIGETTVSAGVGSDPVSVVGGKVYITGSYHGAPFGLSIVNPVKAGPFDLEHDTSNPAQDPTCDCVVVRARIEVNPLTAALTVTTNSESAGYAIPHLIDGIPVQIKAVNVTITRPGFTFNPTNCDPLKITGTIGGEEGASAGVEVPFQVHDCGNLKFEPKFQVSTNGKTSKANGASLTAKVSEPTGSLGTQANLTKVKVELPKQLPSRLTTLQKACTDKQFESNPAACPPESKIGYATVHTPLIPVPLTGPAIFVSHGGEAFPSLTMVLQGYGVTIDLVGTTFISKSGVTSTTFKTVPDQPFSSFQLTLPEGKYSALAANGNLCKDAGKLKMPTEFIAQNGATIDQSTPIEATGCPTRPVIISHRLRGGNLILSVYVPAAGRLKVSGAGLSAASKTVKGRETLTMVLHVNRHGHFKTRLKLSFQPRSGGRQLRALRIGA